MSWFLEARGIESMKPRAGAFSLAIENLRNGNNMVRKRENVNSQYVKVYHDLSKKRERGVIIEENSYPPPVIPYQPIFFRWRFSRLALGTPALRTLL